MSELIYNGQVINQRPDGYVNATEMAKANGVLVADWLRLSQTKAYIAELALIMGIPILDLVQSNMGAPSTGGGTWIHPLLAIQFGRWISPAFSIWCDMNIKTLMETGEVKLEPTPTPPAPKPLPNGIEYLEAAIKLETLGDSILKKLIHEKLVDELSLARNLKAIEGTKQPNWTIVKARAVTLGYSVKEIGNGSALGKYVHALIEPAHQEYVGRFKVYHYEVTDELDAVIHDYFSLKKRSIV